MRISRNNEQPTSPLAKHKYDKHKSKPKNNSDLQVALKIHFVLLPSLLLPTLIQTYRFSTKKTTKQNTSNNRTKLRQTPLKILPRTSFIRKGRNTKLNVWLENKKRDRLRFRFTVKVHQKKKSQSQFIHMASKNNRNNSLNRKPICLN
jgi:hypothetical protein